jgi:hypothetical protein
MFLFVLFVQFLLATWILFSFSIVWMSLLTSSAGGEHAQWHFWITTLHAGRDWDAYSQGMSPWWWSIQLTAARDEPVLLGQWLQLHGMSLCCWGNGCNHPANHL